MKILAVSGGVDSMLLLEMYKEQNEVVVAHVNHGYREESKEEYQMVKKKTQEYGLIFEGKELNLMDTREHAAREARYAFFEELIGKYEAKELIVGHHGDDLLETFLMNVGRKGEGTALIGMAEESESMGEVKYRIKRPLLKFSKEEVYKKAKELNVEWREDASNQSDEKYLRNKIRLNVIPQLKEMFPQIIESVYQITLENKEKEEIVNGIVDKKIKEMKIEKENAYVIKKEEFEKETEYMKKKTIKKIIKKMTKQKTKNSIYLDVLEKINTKEVNTDFQKIKQDVWLIDARDKFYLVDDSLKKKLEEEKEDYKKIKKRDFKNKKIPKAFRKSIIISNGKMKDVFENEY